MTRLYSNELNEALSSAMITETVSLKACQAKLGDDFPATKNFMTILYNLFTSPNREMKQSCYISSIITTHHRINNGKDEHNDYDHNDLNRFVATLLVRNEKSIALVSYDGFGRVMLSALKINQKNYDSFFQQIINAGLPDIDVRFTDNKTKANQSQLTFDYFVQVLKAYRNCMSYAVGHRVLELKKKSKETKNEVREFTDKLVTEFDEVMTPLFSAVATTREKNPNKKQGICKYAYGLTKCFARLDLDLGICRQRIMTEYERTHAMTVATRQKLDKTTLIICPRYFELETEHFQ